MHEWSDCRCTDPMKAVWEIVFLIAMIMYCCTLQPTLSAVNELSTDSKPARIRIKAPCWKQWHFGNAPFMYWTASDNITLQSPHCAITDTKQALFIPLKIKWEPTHSASRTSFDHLNNGYYLFSLATGTKTELLYKFETWIVTLIMDTLMPCAGTPKVQ